MDRIIGILLVMSALLTAYYAYFDSTKVFVG